MTYYNTTNLTSTTNLIGITQQVNILSGYILGFLILLVLLVIMIVAFKNFSIRRTMPAIMFILTLVSILLVILQLIPDLLMELFIVGTAGTIVASIFINPEG